jgi:sugar/nucleoside kinase (ribokinase family)
MTIKSSGDRTFFHARGANAVFSPKHVPIHTFAEKGADLFHLGYILLLDAMDSEDPEFGTAAARLLSAVQDAGIETSIDVVSESSDRFRKLVVPALKYTDHCILNEIEAQKTTGETIRIDDDVDKAAVKRAAEKMFSCGVAKTVVIHFPEGAYWKDSTGHEEFQPSYDLDGAGIVSTVGAGDAFCAGVLVGIHEGWQAEECLKAGTDLACACLFAPDTTGGIDELSVLQKKHSERYCLRTD